MPKIIPNKKIKLTTNCSISHNRRNLYSTGKARGSPPEDSESGEVVYSLARIRCTSPQSAIQAWQVFLGFDIAWPMSHPSQYQTWLKPPVK